MFLAKLFIPGLGLSESTKVSIVSILGEDFPLSAKEIYKRLISDFGLVLKYQSIHKSLTELLNKKIIVKDNLKYKLNPVWVEQIVDYGHVLNEKYLNNHELTSDLIRNVNMGKTVNLVFDQFLPMGHFLINDFYLKFPNFEKKPSVCLWKHPYGVFGLDEKEHENIKKIFSLSKHYAICKGNTFLDNWFNKYLIEMGKSCLSGIDFSVPEDSFINGDYLMQVFLPAKLKENIEEIFSKTTSITDTIVKEYYDKFLTLKTKIHLTIMKNPSLTDAYRKESLKFF